MASQTSAAQHANRFARMEVTGTFGDLATLAPFVVAYLEVCAAPGPAYKAARATDLINSSASSAPFASPFSKSPSMRAS